MENILTIVITSSLVSGLVAIFFGNYFENRRYLKDKKLSAFTNFLDALDYFLHTKIEDGTRVGQWTGEPVGKINSAIWKLKVLSNNPSIEKCLNKMVRCIDGFAAEMNEIIVDSEYKNGPIKVNPNITKFYTEIGELREAFLKESAKEMNSWF